MLETKKEYLMVPADEFYRDLFMFYKNNILGQICEGYSINQRVTATNFFTDFGIPGDYQKIIILINKGILKKEISEFVTGFKFDACVEEVDYLNNKKYTEKYYENTFNRRIKFSSSPNNVVCKEQVISFYRDLECADYLKQYIECMFNFFVNVQYQLGFPGKYDEEERHYTLLKRKLKI